MEWFSWVVADARCACGADPQLVRDGMSAPMRRYGTSATMPAAPATPRATRAPPTSSFPVWMRAASTDAATAVVAIRRPERVATPSAWVRTNSNGGQPQRRYGQRGSSLRSSGQVGPDNVRGSLPKSLMAIVIAHMGLRRVPERICPRVRPPRPLCPITRQHDPYRGHSVGLITARSCHPRATSGGQPRHRADNHGHSHSIDDLVA